MMVGLSTPWVYINPVRPEDREKNGTPSTSNVPLFRKEVGGIDYARAGETITRGIQETTSNITRTVTKPVEDWWTGVTKSVTDWWTGAQLPFYALLGTAALIAVAFLFGGRK